MQLQPPHCLLRDPCLTRLYVQTWRVSEESKRSSLCPRWQEWIPDIWHRKIILSELPCELREKYGSAFLPQSSWPSMTCCCTSSVNHFSNKTPVWDLQSPPSALGCLSHRVEEVEGCRCGMWQMSLLVVVVFLWFCFGFFFFNCVLVFTVGHMFIGKGVEVEAAPQPNGLGSGHLWREFAVANSAARWPS